ncbi:MAG: hypothetical protein AAF288_12905 [Planctomycetota bacterium]
MAKRRPAKRDPKPDVGAAMIEWYSDAIAQHPEGLVTQAQAAHMLDVSRVAVSRLVSRGHLRAVYFPKPPDIEGIAVGQDDPDWLKLVGRLGRLMGETDTYAFPQACYVSFGDVLELWESGAAKAKCAIDWNELMAAGGPKTKGKSRKMKLREIHAEKQRLAEYDRAAQKGAK